MVHQISFLSHLDDGDKKFENIFFSSFDNLYVRTKTYYIEEALLFSTGLRFPPTTTKERSIFSTTPSIFSTFLACSFAWPFKAVRTSADQTNIMNPLFYPPPHFSSTVFKSTHCPTISERERGSVVCVCDSSKRVFHLFLIFLFPLYSVSLSLSFTLCHSDGPEEKKFVERKVGVPKKEVHFQLRRTLILSAGQPLNILYYKTRNGAAYDNGPHAVAG